MRTLPHYTPRHGHAVFLLSALLFAASVATAEVPQHSVALPLYKSIALQPEVVFKRISVGNPGVADIVVLGGGAVQVVGKALGATNLTLWDAKGLLVAVYDVEVVHDLDTLKQKLHALLPGDRIEARSAQENIVLGGQAASLPRMQAALDLAQSFMPECIESETSGTGKDARAVTALPGAGQGRDCNKGKVINLIQVGGAQQVMLEITVAEMSRTLLKTLDSNFNIFNLGRTLSGGAIQGGGNFPNPLTPTQSFVPTTPVIDASGIFLSYLKGEMFLQAVLDLSRRNGLAKILSEPTLTTLNGQEAEFLSGGEFPIPVPQAGTNNTTIEFKEFGVGVKFLPVVLDSGRINLRLNVSVSELSQDNNVALNVGGSSSSFLIPSLTKRSALSTVELADGQTIGIAGLISDTVREFVQKLPGLGDIPGLGALFRSQEFRSGQTELVIFVTPHLAKPIDAAQVRLPTDSFVPPGDLEFYLMGRSESAHAPNTAGPHSAKGGIDGARFGHDLSSGERP